MVNSTILPGVALRKVVDAKKSLKITVKPAHRRGARKCNGNECVVAKAFGDSNIAEFFDGVEVGTTITKVSIPGKILRYATPAKLRPFIREFDKTGIWNFPNEEEFTFSPPSATAKLGGRPSRHHLHRENTDGSGRDTMKKHRAAPTRRISRSNKKED